MRDNNILFALIKRFKNFCAVNELLVHSWMSNNIDFTIVLLLRANPSRCELSDSSEKEINHSLFQNTRFKFGMWLCEGLRFNLLLFIFFECNMFLRVQFT